MVEMVFAVQDAWAPIYSAHRPGLVHADCPLPLFLVTAMDRSIKAEQQVDGPC